MLILVAIVAITVVAVMSHDDGKKTAATPAPTSASSTPPGAAGSTPAASGGLTVHGNLSFGGLDGIADGGTCDANTFADHGKVIRDDEVLLIPADARGAASGDGVGVRIEQGTTNGGACVFSLTFNNVPSAPRYILRFGGYNAVLDGDDVADGNLTRQIPIV